MNENPYSAETQNAFDAAVALRLSRSMGLVDPEEHAPTSLLAGGVSSRILRVDARRGTFCLKQALPRLRVSAEWSAPIERNHAERAWLELAGTIVPACIPSVLASAPEEFAFAMSYFDPARYRVWKQDLLAGNVDFQTAALVGRVLGEIHRQTAQRSKLADQFSNDRSFYALRLEPYLDWTARAYPGLLDRFTLIREQIQAAKFCVIHGDVSPKNILTSGDNIVLLDAECACYGDPAFDVSFCLNHLLLKAIHLPESSGMLREAFSVLLNAYRPFVGWESVQSLTQRAALILPGLMLARIDGKSPVEYLKETDRACVRKAAVQLLKAEAVSLDEICDHVIEIVQHEN